MSELLEEKKKKEECNVVADNMNWSTRVKAELDAAKAWEADWGALYSEGSMEASSKISQVWICEFWFWFLFCHQDEVLHYRRDFRV